MNANYIWMAFSGISMLSTVASCWVALRIRVEMLEMRIEMLGMKSALIDAIAEKYPTRETVQLRFALVDERLRTLEGRPSLLEGVSGM